VQRIQAEAEELISYPASPLCDCSVPVQRRSLLWIIIIVLAYLVTSLLMLAENDLDSHI